mmetsp:Transcript_4896/g.5307  ORF Transcript_4896/g.5307 Transcript_4896/m.5307 type:complete len:387 (+) Transcript_4896:55-1215(+)
MTSTSGESCFSTALVVYLIQPYLSLGTRSTACRVSKTWFTNLRIKQLLHLRARTTHLMVSTGLEFAEMDDISKCSDSSIYLDVDRIQSSDILGVIEDIPKSSKIVKLKLSKSSEDNPELLRNLFQNISSSLEILYVTNHYPKQVSLLDYVLKSTPLPNLTSVEVQDSGNAFFLFQTILKMAKSLEVLKIGWPFNGSKRYWRAHKPTFPIPTNINEPLSSCPVFHNLRVFEVRCFSSLCKKRPTNYDFIASWLLPRMPNLEVILSIELPHSLNIQGLERGTLEMEFARALLKHCKKLKYIHIYESGSSESIRLLFQLPALESMKLTCTGFPTLTGMDLQGITCPTLKYLDIGNLYGMTTKGLQNIAKAFPNLKEFKGAGVKEALKEL